MTDMLAGRGLRGSHAQSDTVGDIDYLGAVTDETLIAEAACRLAKAAPEAKVILFGSYARGDADPDSDLDLLVIEPELKSRHAEFVRLRKELRGLEVAIDLVLLTPEHVEEWGHFEGTMLNDALHEGRVLAGA